MTYRLFIDDERDPTDGEWVVVRSVEDAIAVIEAQGAPSYISFDHDLGENKKTGHDLARWLIDWDIKNDVLTPANFSYYVHSQNPIGKANIEGIFASYFRFKSL
jgi:hypothetical protein